MVKNIALNNNKHYIHIYLFYFYVGRIFKLCAGTLMHWTPPEPDWSIQPPITVHGSELGSLDLLPAALA